MRRIIPPQGVTECVLQTHCWFSRDLEGVAKLPVSLITSTQPASRFPTRIIPSWTLLLIVKPSSIAQPPVRDRGIGDAQGYTTEPVAIGQRRHPVA
jgi:hypothetical protein